MYEQYKELINKNEKYYNISNIVIIESGYYFFFLTKYIHDYETHKGVTDLAKKKKNKKNFFKDSIIDNHFFIFVLMDFLFDLIFSILDLISIILLFILYIFSFGFCKPKDIRGFFYRSNANEYVVDKFFNLNTRSIEILRNDVVYKIYFIFLPYCHNFSKVKFFI